MNHSPASIAPAGNIPPMLFLLDRVDADTVARARFLPLTLDLECPPNQAGRSVAVIRVATTRTPRYCLYIPAHRDTSLDPFSRPGLLKLLSCLLLLDCNNLKHLLIYSAIRMECSFLTAAVARNTAVPAHGALHTARLGRLCCASLNAGMGVLLREVGRCSSSTNIVSRDMYRTRTAEEIHTCDGITAVLQSPSRYRVLPPWLFDGARLSPVPRKATTAGLAPHVAGSGETPSSGRCLV